MLRTRFGDPSVKTSLKGFTKTLQVSLTDTNSDYVFTIRDGELSSLETNSLSQADITLTVESSLMEGILTGKSNAIISYVTGKLKVKGGMDDLLRLQKLLG
jgi:putative sterol carrier protein